MAIRERNYRKNPHTASFLQSFHTASTEAQRTEAYQAEMAETTEQDALAFIRPTAPYVAKSATPVATVAPAARLQAGQYVADIEVNGETYQVKTGPALVTEKQAKWIIDIATTRVSPNGAGPEAVLIRLEQGMARHAGSQFITSYKDLPRKAPTAAQVEAIAPGADIEDYAKANAPAPKVEDGRYALRADGVVKFYHVSTGKPGTQWAGMTFIKIRASDDLHPIRNRAERERILSEIAENAHEAEILYGQELGRCYRCGRTLTDETSRSLGIGPDCRNK
jgi:hypothetical protein